MSTWTKQKFSEITFEKRESYQPSTSEHLPCLELEHIEQQSLRLTGIGDSAEVSSQKKRFQSGDVLYGSLRPYFRKVYKPKFNEFALVILPSCQLIKRRILHFYFIL